jgi:hypothetical protein
MAFQIKENSIIFRKTSTRGIHMCYKETEIKKVVDESEPVKIAQENPSLK